jgi:hypothetical protein
MESVIFENPFAGIRPTLFYNVTIPLEPFNSGFDWDPRPLETAFSLEFLELQQRDWRKLDGHSFTLSEEQSDCSIYIGGSHCPVDVLLLSFVRTEKVTFHIHAQLLCHFDDERLGENALVALDTDVNFRGLVIDIPEDGTNIDSSDSEAIRDFLGLLVELDAYESKLRIQSDTRPSLTGHFLLLEPSRL